MLLARCAALAALASTCVSGSSRFVQPPRAAAVAIPEPYPFLAGGSFSGAPLPFTDDPLGTYVWDAGVNASILQIFDALPANVTTTAGTAPGAFAGVASLLTSTPNVTVSGAGALMLYYAAELAGWVEFDSPDLSPADAARVTLSVSEYNAPEITNLGEKTARPVAYAGAGKLTTYRLEINPGLYEGVRFAWLSVNATPAAPWHVTGFRLVAQVKPTNWGGAFAAAGDDLLSKIWYACAYTVKVNLLSDQFGSILIYRGDRFSWTGDAHVAQATAMAALGDFDFVLANLVFTKNNCNGIESYCLYLILSLSDYYAATGDAAGVALLTPFMVPKLEHAATLFFNTSRPSLGFYSWDDRGGSGFNNATCDEAEAGYRFLALRAWSSWSATMAATGQAAAAAHYAAYAASGEALVRAQRGALWWSGLTVLAAGDALASGIAAPAEAAAIVSAVFNDTVTACALSNFNVFFALQGLASAGELDRALAMLHLCWDVQLELGASTTWETSQPGWAALLAPHAGIPGFEDGFTSMAHPWSSGAAAWASAHLLGVQPRGLSPASSAGERRPLLVRIAPHVAGSMTGVAGSLPTPHGAVSVRVTRATGSAAARIAVGVPAGVDAELRISHVLARRIGAGGLAAPQLRFAYAHAPGACAEGASAPRTRSRSARWAAGEDSALDDGSGSARSAVAALPLSAEGCHTLIFLASDAVEASPPSPFPPPVYPATLVARDTATAGAWLGVYGQAGYSLFAFDGPNKPRESLPPWVASITQAFGRAENGPWPAAAADARALQDPAAPAGPRAIGQFCAVPPPNAGWDPSFPIDIALTAAGEGTRYRLAAYFVDFDFRGRCESVTLMDRNTLAPIAPVELLTNFTGGVWLVWELATSARIRVNFVRGTNQVISALAFDVV